ncbi:SRPBCC family protein [Nocardia sp. 004]|uniref:type II toxin-antitoxin system Rv0910 family toxin n=1 Tax=Nocardia sp. 004 TaxID=3385978 RepID=UPI0039A19DC0
MAYIEETRDVDASPEEIWAFVANPRTWDKWFLILEKFREEPPTVLTEGTELAVKLSALGMASDAEMTVIAITAPNTLVVHSIVSGVKIDFDFNIQPRGTGSAITVRCEFTGMMIRGPIAKAAAEVSTEQVDRSLAQLTALISEEASPQGDPSQ